jgi:hypothetical protein
MIVLYVYKYYLYRKVSWALFIPGSIHSPSCTIQLAPWTLPLISGPFHSSPESFQSTFQSFQSSPRSFQSPLAARPFPRFAIYCTHWMGSLCLLIYYHSLYEHIGRRKQGFFCCPTRWVTMWRQAMDCEREINSLFLFDNSATFKHFFFLGRMVFL